MKRAHQINIDALENVFMRVFFDNINYNVLMQTKSLFIIVLGLMLASCTKVIDIDLNETDRRLVIEANLSTIKDSSMVSITQTSSITDIGPNPKISNAFVTITDTKTNIIDTLNETKPGIYKKMGLQGIEGHSYTLKIVSGEKTFVSTSTIYPTIVLDSINQMRLFDQVDAGPRQGGSGGDTKNTSKQIPFQAFYNATPDIERYFQIKITINDSISNDIEIRGSKEFSRYSTISPMSVSVKKGDKVRLELQGIDKAVFEYFAGVIENLGQNSATPSNPKSNISNGALGYFKAHTSSVKEIVVK
jgi:hypothetical protein